MCVHFIDPVKDMKTKIALVMTLAAVTLAAACGKEEQYTATAPAGEVRNVATTRIASSSMEDFYEATGTVQAKTATQISANIMGRILSMPWDEGDNVARGQVLVEIDNSASRTQIQKAEAGLREAQAAIAEIDASVEAANAAVRSAETSRKLAETTLGRFRELYERKSATAQEFDEAQSRFQSSVAELERAKATVNSISSRKQQINARMEQARAEIAAARINEGYSRIVSPVSGVIVKKFAESGATATPGTPLLSIEDNSQFLLEAAVEESRTNLIRVGNRVNVRIDALGAETFGSVSEILPSADPASRTYTVKIVLPPEAGLRSGMYGVARFPVASKQAVTVPETAVVRRGQLTGVFVVGDDGIARFRIVTLGRTSEGMAEVVSGLSEGDEIVTSDAATLTDGTRVR